MKIRLGYVAISLTLNDYIHYKTLSYSQYQKLGSEKANKKLTEIILNNLNVLENILRYNVKNGIYFYRLSQNMIPLATHPEVNFDYITPFLTKWQKIGQFIKHHQIRVDFHPDQFCVLNSHHEEVVTSSIKILEFIYHIYQALGIDNGKVVLHIGSSVMGKKESIERFKKNFFQLPLPLQQMIMLENDDKIYTIEDTLTLCEDLHIQMVLDYHHYRCCHTKYNLEQFLPRIFATWVDSTYPPKVHFSSPKSRQEKRAHSFYLDYKSFIQFLEIIKKYPYDVDIMLECKGKDEALFRLVRQLKFLNQVKFSKQAVFTLTIEN